MKSTMGRRRKNDLSLPPHMHEKSGTFYYVTSTIPRKWISLGKDPSVARKKWAEIESGDASTVTLGDLLDEWMSSKAFEELSDNTRRQYASVAKQLKAVFADFNSVADIKPHHVAMWQDSHKSKVNANTGKSILSTVMKIAVRRGLIERNPALEVDNLSVERRKRYITHEEYRAIREHADPVLRVAMDLSYVTSARISDILDIHMSNITADGVMIRQIKTGKLQLFKWNDALIAAIENAKKIKRPVRGLYLLSTMRGQPYKYPQINQWWIAARTSAGIDDVRFHDIRGKSATDAKRGG